MGFTQVHNFVKQFMHCCGLLNRLLVFSPWLPLPSFDRFAGSNHESLLIPPLPRKDEKNLAIFWIFLNKKPFCTALNEGGFCRRHFLDQRRSDITSMMSCASSFFSEMPPATSKWRPSCGTVHVLSSARDIAEEGRKWGGRRRRRSEENENHLSPFSSFLSPP